MKRLIFLLPPLAAIAAEPQAEGVAYFETHIRPVLASTCYDCHGPEHQKGGLRLDWREGVLKGGKRGPAIVPGDVENSLLIQAIAHTHAELKMPKAGDPLSAATVEKFREWVRMGAPDPRDKLPEEGSAQGTWPSVFALRKQWWSFLPLNVQDPPAAKDGASANPVDRFLQVAMEKEGLGPAPEADAATRARRAAYVLTGLPPAREAVDALTRDPSPAAWSAYLDRLLASPRFGERWARHWMDWLRYAESHGSEGDPTIRNAWRYRDYLIRALNADVPWPQLVREHIAGDRLPEPRVDKALGVNESAIGPAHLRMVFHGFTPTDALDEFVTFTDNQVDVVSKAFMGLTVSCARCHNHKFDAISQADYYALYGIFASCRPSVVDVAAPAREEAGRSLLALEKARGELGSSQWRQWQGRFEGQGDFPAFQQRLREWTPANDAARSEADRDGTGPLAAWLRLKDLPPDKMREGWRALAGKWADLKQRREAFASQPSRLRWGSEGGSPLKIYTTGPGLADGRKQAPGFAISTENDQVIGNLRPAGLYSDSLSDRHPGTVQSARFRCEGGRLWVRAAGNNAVVRYVVQNYPRSGLIYPKQELKQELPGWISWNVDYWKGEMMYVELTTIQDAPIESNDAPRAWFGLTDVIYPAEDKAQPPQPGTSVLAFDADGAAPPSTPEELARRYYDAVRGLVARQGFAEAGSFEDVEFLNFMLRAGFLPNGGGELAGAKAACRKAEESLVVPVRVPGVMEADGFDQPLYARGDHKKPEAAIPRRFLEAFDPKEYHPADSGRLQLAESLVNPANPLPSRVIVNRLWHHVFGRGIVATTDNFGKLGDLPTHPELLDWLARDFQTNGGSLKKTLKLLLTSRAFQTSAEASRVAAERDPENKLLSHFTLRRLEAEAIRDAILTVSGKLDLTPYGPPVNGGAPRRSVYVNVIRNALDPFLTAFDAPVPLSTRGRRDSTNVPAQALALMNSPMIHTWANDWADRICNGTPGETERVRQLYLSAFSREPDSDEMVQCLTYVHETAGQEAALAARAAMWRGKLEEAEKACESALAPTRESLLAKRNATRVPVAGAPAALADWDFENGGKDRAGVLNLELHGHARVEGGALVVDGRDSYASTPPLPKNLRAKTLEAWVQLNTLEQAGGGVLSLQSPQGEVFDAIVFGEQNIGQWVPGSDNFQRTRNTTGSQEREAATRPVHMAITYAEDGTITAWRDGKRYGRSYQSSGPVTYEAGRASVLIGLRHGDPVGNRLLNGRILRARLYDRALSEKEISVSSRLEGTPVAPAEVLAALSPEDRARHDAALAREEEARRHLAEFPGSSASGPNAEWRSLALALVNMKEFIYLH